MTSTDGNGVAYLTPNFLPGAQIGPRLITASFSTPWFATPEEKDVKELRSVLAIHEYLKTSQGSNRDIVWFAKLSGDQNVRVAYVDPGGATSSLSVEVVDSDVTINLARRNGTIITTANDALAVVAASAAASALLYHALASGSDGTGVLSALSMTALVGPAGTSPTLDVTVEASNDGIQPYPISAAFAQKTAAVAAEGGAFVNLSALARYVFTVSGSGAEFAFSITTIGRR